MFRISLIAVFVAFFGLTSASPDQCRGTCPGGYPNGTAVLLPHDECEKYCQCVYGRPVEMPCPSGLHFSAKDHVCTEPYLANCVRPEQISVSAEQKAFQSAEESNADDECIGECPDVLLGYQGVTVVLAHKKCHKFCKCNNDGTLVQTCPKNLHFSSEFGGCTSPVKADCRRIIEDKSLESSPHNSCDCPTPTPTPTASPTPGDPSGCIGTCPVWGSDKVVHLPHKDCTKFCECDFGTPHVISCLNGLHFNPTLQICDHPNEAGCAGGGTTPPYTPGPTTTQAPGGDPSGCTGTCPLWDGDKVQHLPHRDCTKFCKCDFGTPHVMSCKSGLHFNPKLQVCDRPSEAGCTPGSNPNPPPPPPSGPTPAPPPSGDSSGCIGTCPVWDSDKVQHLPHQDCTKFCKCDFGTPHVMSCKSGLHFNPTLQVCDRPSEAGCAPGSNPNPPPPPPPGPTPAPPPSGDSSGCIGTCPVWDSDKVQHLPHRDCTKFCKCDFGTPHVMSCKSGLHFNPTLQVCDRPSEAGCTPGSNPNPPSPPPPPTSGPTPAPPPSGDSSGCIGTCPVWDSDKVQHLPHQDCTKFCKCDFGTPHVMSCKSGLHFNPTLQVCDRPSEAGCAPGSNPNPPPPPPSGSTPAPPPSGDSSGCIGTCPVWDSDKVQHLPHQDCTKFCKCDFGTPHVMSCKSGLHFNPTLQVCDRPSEAGCAPGSNPNPPPPPPSGSTPAPPPNGDSSGCIGTCPVWDSDKVQHLPHQDCTKFCKCDFGTPHVMSCKSGLHFNPTLQVCDRPSEAGCAPGSNPNPPPPPPSGSTPAPPPSGDSSGCIGTCPVWDSDKVQHLPHRDCTKFCKCDFGTPHVMSCKSGLHFNPTLQVCDRPSEAGCAPGSNPNPPPPPPPGPTPAPPPSGDSSGCIGTCPVWDSDKVQHLPHRDCTKFCKCDFGTPHVMSCKSGLHFNPTLQVCDRPSEAGCTPGSNPNPPSPPPPPTSGPTPAPPPSGDSSGCIGTCPVWDSDKVQHLPHQDCTKFCKCDFGTPHVMSCKSGLHFNPTLQVCDRPSEAGCAPGSNPNPPPPPPSGSTPAPPPSGDSSGCIGTCPVWDSDKVQHLPHQDCTKFCKCDFGTPHVMSCKSGLHFNPTLQVCDRPSEAGCAPGSNPNPPPPPPSGSTPAPPPSGDSSGCIGTCPVWDSDKVQHLPHQDCTKFCKCDFGTPHVMSCKSGLHFNPTLQVCDRPSEAGCAPGSNPNPPPPPPSGSTPAPPPVGDSSGCIGTCPLWEGDDVVHLPHKDCTKFCKCDFGTPHVMSCQVGLHFNPTLQVCDSPGHAGCTGKGGSPDRDSLIGIAGKNIMGFNRLFRW